MSKGSMIGGRACVISAAAMVAFLLLAAGASAATIPVTTTEDSIAEDGLCSLREAIFSANLDEAEGSGCVDGSGADTITVPAGRYTLGPGAFQGQLTVIGEVSIEGAGFEETIVDGGGNDRDFFVGSGSEVRLAGMEITGGRGADSINPGQPGEKGGGIENLGALTIEDCVVDGNRAGDGAPGSDVVGGAGSAAANGGEGHGVAGGAGGAGGGIFSVGPLTVIRSSIDENQAGDGGPGGKGEGGAGGAANGGTGGSGGRGTGGAGGAGGAGGGIDAEAELSIEDSELRGNRSGDGGKGGIAIGGQGAEGAPGHAGGNGGPSFGGPGGSGGAGGGIVASSAEIETTTISENTTGSGGLGAFARSGFAGFGNPSGLEGVVFGGAGGAGGSGAGLSSSGDLTLARSALLSNHAGSGAAGGSAQNFEAEFAFAVGGEGGAGGSGGGLSETAAGSRSVTDSTIDSNTTGSGGKGGDAVNVVLSGGGNGGAGGSGAGIDAAAGGVKILRSTITFNSLGTAAAGGSGDNSSGSTGAAGTGGAIRGSAGTELGASIVFENAAPMCEGTVVDGLNDFDSPSSPCPGSNADPELQQLTDNGGPTPTREIAPTSPAVDLYACEGRDQRGVHRPSGSRCDSGAFEVAPPTVSDPSAEPSPEGAVLHALVNPNARATVVFEYGTTTAYGTTSESTIADSPGEPIDVAVAVGGLKPLTTYHFRARVTSPDGEDESADGTFTTSVPPPPVPPATSSSSPAAPARDTTAPVLSGLAAKPPVFLVGARAAGSALARRRAPHPKQLPTGTAFTFTLSEDASVTFAIERKAPCKKKKGKHTPKGKACSRYVAVGSVAAKGRSGANSVPFDGTIGSKRLGPGTYQVIAQATDAAGNRSQSETAGFAVRKPPKRS